jgi:hypothetical protein
MTPLAPAITQHLPRGPEPEPQDPSRRR